jgi:hypothetical protein
MNDVDALAKELFDWYHKVEQGFQYRIEVQAVLKREDGVIYYAYAGRVASLNHFLNRPDQFLLNSHGEVSFAKGLPQKAYLNWTNQGNDPQQLFALLASDPSGSLYGRIHNALLKRAQTTLYGVGEDQVEWTITFSELKIPIDP